MLNSTDHIIFNEHNFYSVRVGGAVRENSLDMSPCQLACRLVFFQDYIDFCTYFYVRPVFSSQNITLSIVSIFYIKMQNPSKHTLLNFFNLFF